MPGWWMKQDKLRWLCRIPIVLLALLALPQAGEARTLEEIRQIGRLTLCVYPNLLPFSSDRDKPPGVHVELAREIANDLGVQLHVSWIIPRSRRKAGECDLGFDEIEGQEAKGYGMSATRAYLRTGVAMLVRQGSGLRGYSDLNAQHRIGVSLGSEGEVYLKSRDLPVRAFALTQEMERAFQAGELDAILMPAQATAYAIRNKPLDGSELLHAYRDEPRLAWNLVMVLRKPDQAYLDAVNQALTKLVDTGRLAAVYAGYGIPYLAPVTR